MKKVIYLLLFILGGSELALAQKTFPIPKELQEKINALKQCFENEEEACKTLFHEGLTYAKEYDNTVYLNFYRNACYMISRSTGPEFTLYYAQSYLEEAKRAESAEHQLQAILILAVKYRNLSQYGEAKKIISKGIQISTAQKLYTELVTLKIRLSGIFRSEGDFESAEKVAFEALDIAKKHNYSEGIANAYRTLGSVFGMNRMFGKSLEYSLKASAILKSTKDTSGYIVSNINAANAAMSNGMLDTAEALLGVAIDLLRIKKDPYMMAGALVQQARVKFYSNDYKATIVCLEEAYEIALANGNRKQMAYIESTLGDTYVRLGNGDKALKHSLNAYEISKVDGITDETATILNTLSKAYELAGEDKKAIQYFKMHSKLRDSLNGAEKTQQLLDMEKEYEAKIDQQKIENLKRDAELKKWRNTGIIAFISLLAIYAWLLVRKQSIKIRTNRLINSQKEALHKERMLKEALEKKQLEQELNESKRQLISKALKIAENNELLIELEQQLHTDKLMDKNTSAKMLRTLKNSRNHERDWASFIRVFEDVHPDYIETIKQHNEQLTVNDIRLCSLEKMNFSTKQIAAILHISDEGVRKARYRLKKKLGVETEVPISSFLQRL